MIKRIFDTIVASAALLVLGLPLLVLILLVRVKLGEPVMFRQKRPGLNGEIFEIIKLRTMSNATGVDGALLSDDERKTKFGEFLRSTSLDELPELWNVIKGDMSLVGPRPLLVDYLPLYTAEQARRHEVRPGITGWAQINGRNALSWQDKFKLDLWYVENRSIWLDMKILIMTVKKVVSREDIQLSSDMIAPPFPGLEDNED